jgi:hypothetical protein
MLNLPQAITVQLLSNTGEPFRRADVLLGVHAFARRKNDYWLGPYPTDEEGVARISREALLADVDATHDSGLMDYAGITECEPVVELAVWSADQIRQALVARREIWRSLLRGEERRWKSVPDLIALYERALTIANEEWAPVATVSSDWSLPGLTHTHILMITHREI